MPKNPKKQKETKLNRDQEPILEPSLRAVYFLS